MAEKKPIKQKKAGKPTSLPGGGLSPEDAKWSDRQNDPGWGRRGCSIPNADKQTPDWWKQKQSESTI